MIRVLFILLSFLFFQVFLFNSIEPGYGVYIMVYPLAIALLPFKIKPILLFLICFLFGFSIDFFSNTFGLHSSALIVAGLARVFIFNLLSPRDGYEAISHPSIGRLGAQWAFVSFSFILFIHHFWFFLIEFFKFSEFFSVLQSTFLSFIFSFLACFTIYILFLHKKNER